MSLFWMSIFTNNKKKKKRKSRVHVVFHWKVIAKNIKSALYTVYSFELFKKRKLKKLILEYIFLIDVYISLYPVKPLQLFFKTFLVNRSFRTIWCFAVKLQFF